MFNNENKKNNEKFPCIDENLSNTSRSSKLMKSSINCLPYIIEGNNENSYNNNNGFFPNKVLCFLNFL